MSSKRVVVTGLGVASCFGNHVDDFYDALLAGKSGVSTITSFPCEEYPTDFAAWISNFDSENLIDKKQARRIDPFIAYALVASKKAINDAGYSESGIDPSQVGVIVGSGMGGMQRFSDGLLTVKDKGFSRLTPFFIPYIITNMAGGLLAIEHGFSGPNYSVSTACATGSHAIHLAAEHIRRGDAEMMVCGGSEAPITEIGLAGFVAVKALSRRKDNITAASRPWDKSRDGFVMGEGAGVLVLESLDSAKKRGATIYAEYLGGAVNCDAYHLTDPKPDGSGVRTCIEHAVKDAKINVSRVNYINAHATSTPPGDPCEINALRGVFKENIQSIPINATKSMIGHSLGAAGGIEAVVAVKAIESGVIHPTINLDDPDDCIADLHIPTKAINQTIDVALSNSFGFGGHNAALLFGAYS